MSLAVGTERPVRCLTRGPGWLSIRARSCRRRQAPVATNRQRPRSLGALMPRWVAVLAVATAIFAIGSDAVVHSGLIRTADQGVYTKGFRPKKALVRTQGAALNERSGASTADAIVGTVPNGSTVSVTCQRFGQQMDGAVSSTPWWVQL